MPSERPPWGLVPPESSGQHPTPRPRLRLFIVEDDPLLRQSLELLLRGEPSLEVVGVASSVAEALAAFDAARPDVALVDLGLPDGSGSELIAKLKARHQDLEILAYTVFEDRQAVMNALKAGASGYILKGGTPRELIEALHHVREGGVPMSAKIGRAVLRELQGLPDSQALTLREKQVLRGIDRGLAYKELAAELGVSVHTVHSHLKRVYERLHAHNKQEALAKAKKQGLL